MHHLGSRSTTSLATGIAAIGCAMALAAAIFFAVPAYAGEESDIADGSLAPSALEAQSATSGNLLGATWKLSAMPGQNPYSLLTITPDASAGTTCAVAPESGYTPGSDGLGWNTSVNAGNTTSTHVPPWYGHRDDITNVVIEPGITHIGSYAFDQCSNLRHVTIPSTVEIIGTGAFLGCELPELTIPDGVWRIGNWAFEGCEFTEVTIPKSVKSIGARAFATYKDTLDIITFEGDAPAVSAYDDKIINFHGFTNDPFVLTEATAYYPAFNKTWTDKAKMTLAEEAPIKWIPQNSDGSKNRVWLDEGCTASLAKTSYTYNGKVRKPAVTVWSLNYKLKSNEYKVKYKNNKKAGTATAIVTGRGDFTGTLEITFKIKKAKNTLTASTNAKTFNVNYKKAKKAKQTLSKAKVFDIAKNKGEVTFKKVSGHSKITVSKAGKVTVKKGMNRGSFTVKVKVTAAGTSNYKARSKTLTFKIKVD